MTLNSANMTAPGDQMNASGQRVVVIGGGLAGIAAALKLAEQGKSVTLVETRKRLGGRATSFVDPTTGQVLDNCQHVVMKCCTNLLDLYERLGVLSQIQWHKTFYFCDGQGRIDELTGDDLPAPLHMARSLLSFKTLTWGEKLAISQAMRAMMLADRTEWEDRSFSQWLEYHGQPAGAVEKFWKPVVVGAINEWPERMAASAAIQVFQEGFLAHEDAYWMGLSNVPLVRLYDQAQQAIEAAGGKVMLATSANKLEYVNGRVTALEIDDGQKIEGDVFISALPFDRLDKICPPALVDADSRLHYLESFEVSPIIGIHLWLHCTASDPVIAHPHISFMQSPLHWIFNKGYDEQADGQHLHGVISAAHDLVDLSAQEITELVMHELHHALPQMRGARVLHSRVIKEKRATFSDQPGVDRIRPVAAGDTPNLFLAGDWCASGWPATMEGAVRSGYMAAAAVMQAGNSDQAAASTGLVADLPKSRLYRFLGGR